MNDSSVSFEEKKWSQELALKRRELELKERETSIREKDAEIERLERERSRWTNPLVLAIFAAALAAAGGAVVALLNGRSALEVEEFKAESSRILQAINVANPDSAAQNLRFFVEIGLITDIERRKYIEAYLAQRPGGSGISILETTLRSNADDPANSPDSTNDQQSSSGKTSSSPERFTYQSGWVAGGHDQHSICARGQADLQSRYGLKLQLIRSDETSRKDWTGQASYNYFCEFESLPKS